MLKIHHSEKRQSEMTSLSESQQYKLSIWLGFCRRNRRVFYRVKTWSIQDKHFESISSSHGFSISTSFWRSIYLWGASVIELLPVRTKFHCGKPRTPLAIYIFQRVFRILRPVLCLLCCLILFGWISLIFSVPHFRISLCDELIISKSQKK